MKADELKLGECLGSGSFGKVYDGTFRNGRVAVKRLEDAHLSIERIRSFANELQVMW